MDESSGSITMFLHQMMAGDEAAVAVLWERFLPRLLALSRKTLSRGQERMADAEDAVQSAFASFWKGSTEGEFRDVNDRFDLWNILSTITVRKVRKQVRHEKAVKRGGGHVITESNLASHGDTPGSMDSVQGYTSTDLDLNCVELLAALNDEHREIAVLRLFGYLNSEIAQLLDCSERSVERKVRQIRQQWQPELAAD